MPIGEDFDKGKILRLRWDDISVSATQTKVGSNLKPDFDFTNLGLLFPQNDTSEKIYSVFQMSHRKKLGSSIQFHIHYIQSSANKPIFTIQYRFYNNGSLVPSYSTLNTSDVGGNQGVFSYTSGSMLQIAKFPEITAPANETVSANLDIILYRNDNTVIGDVLVKYIDLHYQIDSDGSRSEYSK